MSGWPTVALGDIFEIARGGSPRPIDDFITAADPAGINWIMISDAIEGSKYITGTRKRIRPEGAQRSRRVKPGDFLLTNSMSFGKPYIMRTEGCIHDGWLVLSPRGGDVDADFFYHLLGSKEIYAEFGRRASGATVKNLNIDLVRGVTVPLPPLAEQRRIAEILDKADALRAKRRAALAQLDTLTQSIFLDMFGDPATNPKGWPLKRIADITVCLDRLRRPVTESERKPGNVPYYGANGQQGWIDTALFDEPLVLVAEDGGYFDAPERGVAYRIDGPAWVNNHAHILSAIREHVETEFLHRALRHFNFLPYISGTTRAKLTQGQLNSVKLFVPPLDLQREFREKVAVVERIARATSLSGNQLDALFASLQHRAFRGDVKPGLSEVSEETRDIGS